jgi:hypothetical protein
MITNNEGPSLEFNIITQDLTITQISIVHMRSES